MKKKYIGILLFAFALISSDLKATEGVWSANPGCALLPHLRGPDPEMLFYCSKEKAGGGSPHRVEAVNDQNSTWQDVNCSGNVLNNDFDPFDILPLTFDGFIDSAGSLHNNGVLDVYAADGVTFAGVLTVSSYGFYSFDPEPSFTGTVNVSYQIRHNYLNNITDTGVLQIGVYPLPQQTNSVIATNDEYVTYGTSITGNILKNDGDPQGHIFAVTGLRYDPDGIPGTPTLAGTLSTQVVAGGVTAGGMPTANAGILILNSNGTFSFDPTNNFYGEIIFTYTICDAFSPAACDSAILNFDVIPDTSGATNTAPFAGDDFVFIPVNNQTLFDFFANDYDPDGNSLYLNGSQIIPGGPHTAIGGPVFTTAGGSLQFYTDGNVRYIPPANFSGPDYAHYQICDNGVSPLCANATIYLLCGGDADLSVSKAAVPDTALTGQPLIYSVIATNFGPGTAFNVVIVDVVTAFPSPEYATDTAGPWAPWTGSFNAGTLDVNESDTVFIRGALGASQCGSVMNVASVGSSTPDNFLANNSDRIMTMILDPIPPTITCRSNQIRNTNNGLCTYKAVGSEFDPLQYSDNCGGTGIAFALAGATSGGGTVSINGSVLNNGITTVTWTVTDIVGNTTSCSFDVQVIDNTAPLISCAVSGTQNVIADNSGIYTHSGNSWDATATDNCGVSSLTFDLSGATAGSGTTLDNTVFNTGITTVTWTASDSSGNAVSCSFNVHVMDTTGPVISCAVTGTQIVSADSNCNYSHGSISWDATATDNCGVQSLTFSLSGATAGSGTTLNNVMFNKGNTTVIWTATDSSGNSVNCSFIVQVNDTTDPVVICPAAIQVSSTPGACSVAAGSVILGFPAAGDNCGIATILNNAPVVTFPAGLTNVIWTITDNSGNSASCLQPVVVSGAPLAVTDSIAGTEDMPLLIDELLNDVDCDNDIDPATVQLIANPAHGTATVNPLNGTISFIPQPNYYGTDQFVYEVCDSGGLCSQAYVILTIGPVNDAPVTVNEYLVITQNLAYSGTLLNGDFDPDSTSLDAQIIPVVSPAHGAIIIHPGGSFTYTPFLNYTGSDTIVVMLCDHGIPMPSACSYDTLFLAVTLGNAPPVTFNEQIALCEDGAIAGNILSNGDWDPDGTPLSVLILPVLGPMHGIAVVNSNGDFIYVPQPGFSGTDTLVVGVYDAGIPLPPAISNDTVFITVNAVFAADGGPSQQWCGATNTFLAGNMPAGTTGAWSQLMGPNTVLISPANAAVAGVSGMISGTYAFVYTLTTVYPSGNCISFDTVTVINFHHPSLSYAGPDQIICAFNGAASAMLGSNVPLYGHGVWTQVSGPALAVFSDSLSNTATVSNLIPGDYVFNWSIKSGICAEEYDYVNIHVNASPLINAGPDMQTCQGIPLALSAATAANCQSIQWLTSGTGIFSNSLAINPLYYPSLADAQSGSVVLTLIGYGNSSCGNVLDSMTLTVVMNPILACPPGVIENADSGRCDAFVNVPAPNLTAGNGCVIAVVNSHNGTSDASGIYPVGSTGVTWTVTFANGAVAGCSHTVTVNDTIRPTITCPGNISLNILSGCDATDAIPVVLPGDNCSISSLTWAMNGATTATSPPGGINQVGVYSFNRGMTNIDFVATDQVGNAATCSVTVVVTDTIIPTILCPAPLIATTSPGACTAGGIWLGAPLAADNCTFTTITCNAPSIFPLDTTLVLYTVTDSSGNTAGCSQVVVVHAAPYAAVDFAYTDEDTPVMIDVLANDSDCDSNINPAGVSVIVQPVNGLATVDPVSGAVLYMPYPDFFGADQFDYQVCDSTGLCAVAAVYINVMPVNDPPVVTDSIIYIYEDSSITICLPVSDPDGPFPLILSGVNCTSNGYHTVSLTQGSVCVTYTPFPDYSGIDTVCILICDSSGLCDVGMLIINVIPVNDPPYIADTLVNLEQDSTLVLCLTIWDVDGAMPFTGQSLGCAENGIVNAYVSLDALCITYIPDPGFIGLDTVCILLCDAGGACSVVHVYINVFPHDALVVIGLAKSAGIPEYKPDGSFDMIYTFTLSNLGNRTLYNVQVSDNLKKTFPEPVQVMLNGPSAVSGHLIFNCQFNGISDTNLLFAPGSFLLPGQTETITLKLKIIPNGSYGMFMNSAFACAIDSGGSFTWDISNRGTVADPDGDGNPNETGENCATPVFLQPSGGIGLAKAVSEIVQLQNGSFDIVYVITVQNLGLDSLSNIIVKDVLNITFPAPVVFSVVEPPSANSTLTANASYDGVDDVDLLIPEASFLQAQQTGTITFTVNVDFTGNEQTFYNTAAGTANTPFGLTVSDSSDNGYIPDANGNGKADDAGENEPTPLTLVPLNVFIPDGFSPDGDGINDRFVISGISRYPDCRFIVFNRWGNQVFAEDAYNNGWDGSAGNNSLGIGHGRVPQGTYYYILEFNKDNMEPATGFIVIKY